MAIKYDIGFFFKNFLNIQGVLQPNSPCFSIFLWELKSVFRDIITFLWDKVIKLKIYERF